MTKTCLFFYIYIENHFVAYENFTYSENGLTCLNNLNLYSRIYNRMILTECSGTSPKGKPFPAILIL